MELAPNQYDTSSTKTASRCPFLEVFPLEIREIIYNYVIMEKVAKTWRSHQVCMPNEDLSNSLILLV